MKIRKLILHKVACFEHAEIEFQPGRDPNKADIHILVGPNGTGKSTILMALAQFFSLSSTGLRYRFHGPESWVILETKDGYRSALAFRIAIDWKPAPDLSAQAGRLDKFFYYQGNNQSSINVHREKFATYDPREPDHIPTRFSFAAFAYSGLRSTDFLPLVAIQEPEGPPLQDALDFKKGVVSQQLVQWIANSKAKVAFALAKNDRQRAEERQLPIERIEQVITSITGKQFQFNMDDDPLKVTAIVDHQEVELDVLPDGLKSILSWIADLLMRMDRIPWANDTPVLERPFLLFLDEIEVHLHPAWQRKVLPTVQGLFPNAQVFISTHSPFIIASADDAWIYPLHESAQGTVVGKPLSSMIGQSYSTVLRDVMVVKSEFAPQVEDMLDQFYALRNAVLSGKAEMAELKDMAGKIHALGDEVAAIVVPELRQVERLLAMQQVSDKAKMTARKSMKDMIQALPDKVASNVDSEIREDEGSLDRRQIGGEA